MMKRVATFALGLLLGFASNSAAQPTFQVNTHTTGSQMTPDIAMTGDGRFVVVWAGAAQDGSGLGIFGRRFDPPITQGSPPTPSGSEFQVNSHTTAAQSSPRVAMDGLGRFIVVWRSVDQDGDRGGIFGQRFESTGLPAGGEFAINSSTVGDQLYPDVGADDEGGFVVVWQTKTSSSQVSPVDIVARRFDSTGAALASEFTVSTETRYSNIFELSPAVAMNNDGRFVIVWGRPEPNFGYPYLYGRIFDPSGQPAGGELTINQPGDYPSFQPSVDMVGAGEFVVVWGSGLEFSMNYSYGRRFDPDGSSPAGTFSVNGAFLQKGPDVAVAEEGSFVVVWGSYGDVRAVRFNSSGIREGGQIAVSETGSDPAVDMDSSRSFVVSWADDDGSQSGIFGWRFGCPGPVSNLRASLINGGLELRLTWDDGIDSSGYTVFEDDFPYGSFLTQTGTAATGTTGLAIPVPPGTKHYLVAGQSASCGIGPLR